MIRPNFFIAGAPKCGTTAMNDYLAQHPAVFMAKKELHYFGADLAVKLRLTEGEYLDYFENAGDKKIIGEASVWYLYSKTAAQEIKDFSPGAKILIMLRNPVDVVHSMHSQHLYDGNEDVTDFETALNLDEERKKGNRLPAAVDFYVLPPYGASVLFAVQVKRYLDVFGKENVHIVLYDDFVADTEKAVAGVLEFLDLSDEIKLDYAVINPNKQIRSFALHRTIKNPPAGLKKIARLVLPFKALRHRMMSYLFNRNIVLKKREKMSDELRQRLKLDFADDIKKLEKIINRDLSAWL